MYSTTTKRVTYKKNNCLPVASTWVPPSVFMGYVLLILLFFCLLLFLSFFLLFLFCFVLLCFVLFCFCFCFVLILFCVCLFVWLVFCCFFCFFFCLRPMSCVPNVFSVYWIVQSWLPLSVVSNVFLYYLQTLNNKIVQWHLL